MDAVKKAVIPAAGLGTRFLPATKSVPKELLTIVDKPILFYVVDEAVRAGVEEIILITGRNKSAIEDFFDVSYELQDVLERTGKTELLKNIQNIQQMAKIVSIRQKQALGLGHAVLCAEPAVGKQPFAVLLGDEIMISRNEKTTQKKSESASKNVTQLLIELHQSTGLSSVALMEVSLSEVSKYGIATLASGQSEAPFRISEVVEKPAPEQAASRWALPGRYVFDAKIFFHLAQTAPGKNGEIQLTDGLTQLAQREGLLGTSFSCTRYDAGDKVGFLRANVELGLAHPEIGDQFKAYLLEYVLRHLK